MREIDLAETNNNDTNGYLGFIKFIAGTTLFIILMTTGLACQKPNILDPGPIVVDPGDEPGDNPGYEPGDEPGEEPADEPGDESDEPGDEPGVVPGDETGDVPTNEPKPEPKPVPNPGPVYHYFDPNDANEREAILASLESAAYGTGFYGNGINRTVGNNLILVLNHIAGDKSLTADSLIMVSNLCAADVHLVADFCMGSGVVGSDVHNVPVPSLFSIKKEQDYINALRIPKLNLIKMVANGCTIKELETPMENYKNNIALSVLNNKPINGITRSSLGNGAQYTAIIDVMQAYKLLEYLDYAAGSNHFDQGTYDKLESTRQKLLVKICINEFR